MKAAIKKLMKGEPQFEQLVDEALAIHRELVAACTTYGDARDDKLSAKGYVAEALKNAHCDLATIERLDKVVSNLPEDSNQQLLRFVAEVTKKAAATRVDQGCNLRPVKGNLHSFFNYDNAAMVEAIVQSNMLGSNPFELVALAAYRATRDFPDNFGSIENWDAHEVEQADRQRRFEDVCRRIAEGWHAATYRIEDITADGRGRIVLTVKGIEIPLGDPATLGQRLCEVLH